MTSFRDRSMNLADARPAILAQQLSMAPEGTGNVAQRMQSHLSINAPRTVYSTFSDDATEQQDARQTAVEPSGSVDSTFNAGQCAPAAGRVQWGKPQVHLYLPSPNCSGAWDNASAMPTPTLGMGAAAGNASTSSGWLQPHQHAAQPSSDSQPQRISSTIDALIGTAHANNDELSGPVSRCASNMAQRAGTFDEVLSAGCAPQQQQQQRTRRSSNAAFDAMLASGESPQRRTALAAFEAALGGSPGEPPSRRASNMAERAGTFNEVLEADTFLSGRPADQLAGLSTNTQHLLDVDIAGESDGGVSRHASTMKGRAGTFDELVPGPPPSGTPSARWQLAARGDDAYAASDDASGAISRRATNMADAAGHFDALVDEDGDELPAEEYSDRGMDSPGLPAATGATAVRNIVHNSNTHMRGVTVSFSGMVSDADVLRAAGSPTPGERSNADNAMQHYFGFDAAAFPTPPRRSSQERGAAAAAHIRAASAAAEMPGLRDSWATIPGGLMSDVASSVDEDGCANPFDFSGVQAASGDLDSTGVLHIEASYPTTYRCAVQLAAGTGQQSSAIARLPCGQSCHSQMQWLHVGSAAKQVCCAWLPSLKQLMPSTCRRATCSALAGPTSAALASTSSPAARPPSAPAPVHPPLKPTEPAQCAVARTIPPASTPKASTPSRSSRSAAPHHVCRPPLLQTRRAFSPACSASARRASSTRRLQTPMRRMTATLMRRPAAAAACSERRACSNLSRRLHPTCPRAQPAGSCLCARRALCSPSLTTAPPQPTRSGPSKSSPSSLHRSG